MSNLIQKTTELALHIVAAYVEPGDTVIDATCGNGHDTLALARMRPGRLYAFDIQPRAVRATRQLLAKAGFAPEDSNAGDSAEKHPVVGAMDTTDTIGDFEAMAAGASPAITVTCLGHEHMRSFLQEHAAEGALRDTGCMNSEEYPRAAGAAHSDEELPPSESGFAAAILFNLGYLPGGDKTLTTRADTTLAAVRGALELLRRDGLLCITMYSGHPQGAEEKRALLAFAEGLDPHRYHVSYVNMLNQKKAPPEILLISRKG